MPVRDNAASQPSLSEAALIERCTAGDLGAFDELVARHQDKVFNLCFWVLGDRDEAADAAQDAFLRAYRALPKFRGDAAFGTWLHRIAVNVARDAANRRKKAPLPFSSIDEDEDRPFNPPAPQSSSPANQLLKVERQRVVQSALGTLPEHHRLVLVLFDLQGHSYEEVGNLLKLPLGTVKSRLNRARGALREALTPHRELFEGDESR